MSPRAPLPCCRHIIECDEQLVIETASGQRITLQQSSVSVSIEDANGNIIRLDPTGITIMAGQKVVISALTSISTHRALLSSRAWRSSAESSKPRSLSPTRS